MRKSFPISALFYLILFLLLTTCRSSGIKQEYQFIKSATGENGMVVTAHPLASEVGVNILRQGGNAADAAIAVQLALAVVYPRAGNLGGGGFLMYRHQAGDITSLDYREKAPLSAERDMYLDTAGNIIPNLSTEGIRAAGIPGTVAGLIKTYEKFGSLKPFSRLVEPAIHLAEKGFRLTQTEADRLNEYQEIFRKYNSAEMPFISDTPWKAGDMLVQKELATTLRQIAVHGRDGFYAGQNAQALIALSTSTHGLFTMADLEEYQAIWRKPITHNWRGYELHSMGLPSSGGIILGQILMMIENGLVDSLGHQDYRNIHRMVEAERRAYMDRAAYLGDSEYYAVDVEKLLDEKYLLDKFSDFDTAKASASLSIPSQEFMMTKDHFETTHISIADRNGNAASVTTTLNDNYGCKVWVPGGGYFLNNEMDDFSAKPGVPNLYGLTGSEANAIAPGKRMLSSMTPTIIEKDDKLWMVLGTPGGSTIITSVLQVFLNVASFGMDLEQAVESKRFHHQWLPDEIMLEEGAFSPDLESRLKQMGHHLKPIHQIGLVEAILIGQNGKLHGVADHRSDDHAAGW